MLNSNFISGFKSSRMFFIVLGIVIYLIESFYPLGNFMHDNFGLFGDLLGIILTGLFWISVVWKLYDKINKL